MPLLEKLRDGYYWCRHHGRPGSSQDAGTTFIALLEEGMWYICGVASPINAEFDPAIQVVGPVKPMVH